MNFSDALNSCKSGSRISREGWNGKGQFVALQKGYPQGVPANENTAKILGISVGETVKVAPYLVIKNAQGEIVPWLASQGDLLAEDWLATPI